MRLSSACLLLALVVPALADRIYWGCTFGPPKTLHSGPIDCTQAVSCQKMALSCRRGANVLFNVEDFADYIAVSDDGAFILGLSNRGSENAWWIRNPKGKILYSGKHSPGDWSSLHYCQESITNIREWFDAGQPNVRFQVLNGKLSKVLVRGCDGKDIPLLK